MASFASKLKGTAPSSSQEENQTAITRFAEMQTHYLNPGEQTATYTTDLQPVRYASYHPTLVKYKDWRDTDEHARIESAVVEKRDTSRLIINYKNKGTPHNYGEFDTSPEKKPDIYKLDFKVGVMVFAVDEGAKQLYIVAWHEDDVNFSIITPQGKVVKTCKLPEIPADYVWASATFRDSNTLVFSSHTCGGMPYGLMSRACQVDCKLD